MNETTRPSGPFKLSETGKTSESGKPGVNLWKQGNLEFLRIAGCEEKAI